MFTNLRKQLAIKSYIKKLGPALRQRYGRRSHYYTDQVRRSASSLGLSTDCLCYGYAMYCDREGFDYFHAAMGQDCNYDGMRAEVMEYFGTGFSGDLTFDAAQVIDLAAPAGSEGDPGTCDHGTGFDGGSAGDSDGGYGDGGGDGGD